jgi:hypothetical protein
MVVRCPNVAVGTNAATRTAIERAVGNGVKPLSMFRVIPAQYTPPFLTADERQLVTGCQQALPLIDLFRSILRQVHV